MRFAANAVSRTHRSGYVIREIKGRNTFDVSAIFRLADLPLVAAKAAAPSENVRALANQFSGLEHLNEVSVIYFGKRPKQIMWTPLMCL